MRFPALAMLIIAAALTTTPALAQTYDPKYPVCLQIYGIGGGGIDCSYRSLAVCSAAASGRAAECIANPFFARAQRPAEPHYRRGVY
jgi:hypothetical protein